ncbi:MAG: hypothetical protein RSC41_00440, partial [Oscillospiraceae bacterium]
YNNYMTRAEKRIDKARLMAIEQENEKRNLCQKNFEEISQGMDKIFEEKKEQWVQDLFEKCIE